MAAFRKAMNSSGIRAVCNMYIIYIYLDVILDLLSCLVQVCANLIIHQSHLSFQCEDVSVFPTLKSLSMYLNLTFQDRDLAKFTQIGAADWGNVLLKRPVTLSFMQLNNAIVVCYLE